MWYCVCRFYLRLSSDLSLATTESSNLISNAVVVWSFIANALTLQGCEASERESCTISLAAWLPALYRGRNLVVKGKNSIATYVNICFLVLTCSCYWLQVKNFGQPHNIWIWQVSLLLWWTLGTGLGVRASIVEVLSTQHTHTDMDKAISNRFCIMGKPKEINKNKIWMYM